VTDSESVVYNNILRARDLTIMFSEMGNVNEVLRYSASPASWWEPQSVYARIEALQACGRHDAAVELCELAMCQFGLEPKLLSLSGYAYALTGDWEKLFLIHALVCKEVSSNRDIQRWRGEAVDGKHVLVCCDPAGYGDNIQYARFLAAMGQAGASLTVQCGQELRRLFSAIPGVVDVVDFSVQPDCDFTTGILEIPHYLGIGADNIPSAPYLAGEGASLRGDTFNVGISWGCKNESQRMKRACRLAELAPLAAVPGIQLYSIEKGPARKDISPVTGLPLIDLADTLHDFADTADAIASLDAVVTVDSAVANLAGAMGKPLFVLTPFFTDCRWGNSSGSLWYPTARVYRQVEAGEWAEPIGRLIGDLSALSRARLCPEHR
jgi:hypothetical protein